MLTSIEDIAEAAYLYAYPILVGYGFFLAQTQGPERPEKQYVNQLRHFRQLAGPSFNNHIPWINTDFINSSVWLDLRAEPQILTVPAMEPHRFQDIQANDWYTMCFVTRGTRDIGNGGGTYVFAGPDWAGEKPAGIDEVIRSEGWIVKLFARLLVEGPDDLPTINALQDRFALRSLSAYLGRSPPPVPPAIEFPAPDPVGFAGRGFFTCPSPDFIRYLNFLLTLVEPHPGEAELLGRFTRIGVAPGQPFDAAALEPAMAQAIQAGIDAALARIEHRLAHLDAAVNGWVWPLDLRGGRSVLAGDPDAYLRRAVLAKYAIWGPPAEEVVYMVAEVDGTGAPLDGSQRYTLRFDRPPPVKGYWSLTVYDRDTRLLSAHPSGRYRRSDRDRDMVFAPDGSLTIHLQHEPPADAPMANWLPVPAKPFQLVARLYWADQQVLDRRYLPPPVLRAG